MQADFSAINSSQHFLLCSLSLRSLFYFQSTFSFEAGRRCESGQGVFEFSTSRADSLFRIINTAISAAQETQRPCLQPTRSLPAERAPETDTLTAQVNVCSHQGPESMPPPPLPPTQGIPPKPDRQLKRLSPSFRSLSLNTIKPPNKDLVRNISSCPPLKHEDQEVIYAQVSRQKLRDQALQQQGGACGGRCERAPEDSVSPQVPFETSVNFPPSDAFEALQPEGGQSSEECKSETECFITAVPTNHSAQLGAEETADMDHIYDDPEGCLTNPYWEEDCVVYDDPEEVKIDKGQAKLESVVDSENKFLYDNIMTGGNRQ